MYCVVGLWVSCVEGWCCVLGWCPFYSLGVMAALCSPTHTASCIDPGLWTLLSWLGYTMVGVVPLIWLCGDADLRQLVAPRGCASSQDQNSIDEVAMKHSSAGSIVSTEFSTVERLPIGLPLDWK